MHIIAWLLAGGLILGMVLNVVVGVFGAGLAGWLLSPLVGASMINGNSLSIPSLLVSLVGAAALLTLVNVVNRSRAK